MTTNASARTVNHGIFSFASLDEKFHPKISAPSTAIRSLSSSVCEIGHVKESFSPQKLPPFSDNAAH
jgi:hypothetical protein